MDISSFHALSTCTIPQIILQASNDFQNGSKIFQVSLQCTRFLPANQLLEELSPFHVCAPSASKSSDIFRAEFAFVLKNMVSDFKYPLDMDVDSYIRDDMVLEKSGGCGLSAIFFPDYPRGFSPMKPRRYNFCYPAGITSLLSQSMLYVVILA
jgi:hypothetical protein